MVKQFRSLSQTNLIPLVLIALILRLFTFIHRPEELHTTVVESFVSVHFSFSLDDILSPSLNMLVALIVTVIQGLVINRIINAHNIFSKPTSMPALTYITLSSLFPQFLFLNPVLLCNFLLIWLVGKILDLYQSPQARFILFDMGMILGLGTLIYFPFIAILPLLWISLIIFRPFVWREWIMGLMGFLVIFFFLGVLYFWNDSLGAFYKIWRPLQVNYKTIIQIQPYGWLPLIPTVIILLLGLIYLQQNFFRSPIHVRKGFQACTFLFALALCSVYLKPAFSICHFLLCVPTFSILISYYFLHEKRRWLYESLYIFWLGAIVLLQTL